MTELILVRGRMERVRDAVAPCFPSKQLPPCKHCARRNDGSPGIAAERRSVVIDGAITAHDGICCLFELRVPQPNT